MKRYTTYAGWRCAIRQTVEGWIGQLVFEGDKDICQAKFIFPPEADMPPDFIGEWDGEKGEIYQ